MVIYDPHSDACVKETSCSAGKYISITMLIEIMDDGLINFDPAKDYIVLPDEGAFNRYSDMIPDEYRNVIYAEKKRDFNSGKILSLEVNADFIPGRKCLILG